MRPNSLKKHIGKYIGLSITKIKERENNTYIPVYLIKAIKEITECGLKDAVDAAILARDEGKPVIIKANATYRDFSQAKTCLAHRCSLIPEGHGLHITLVYRNDNLIELKDTKYHKRHKTFRARR